MSRPDGEDDDIAVAPGRGDLPGGKAGDGAVTGLRDGHVLAGPRVTRRRDLGAVVVGPLAVLVLEDRLCVCWTVPERNS